MKKSHSRLFYIGVLAFAALFLFVGNRIASGVLDFSEQIDDFTVFSAVVTSVTGRTEDAIDMGYFTSTDITITFNARITNGARRGETVQAQHTISGFLDLPEAEVEAGDRVVLGYDDFSGTFFFMTHQRINSVLILGFIFLLLMILFGRKKGFNSIVALGFICMAIFMVFVPAILSGRNIYIATFVTVIYSIVTTLLIVIGPNKKAISAMLGCLGGVLFAAILMAAMNGIVQLTGFIDHETRSLIMLNPENPINLQAIIFAGVIIGSAGAIMDVAMSIASSLWEVKLAGVKSDFRSIFKSGIEIGKDILGTMLNTLILAYIGSSITVILLITAHSASFAGLFNTEMIIVELLRALVGSFGMFLTLPLTAAICGALYTRKPKDTPQDTPLPELQSDILNLRAEQS
ncbi:MAG: YibE/F family protein [Oscillospiraceae bacterium]|nr:YibE/F family protein [Oscillospiraceae bacterium]